MTKKKKISDSIYIVSYKTGYYEDRKIITVFATTKKSTATKYVTKFNKLVKKWYNYYKQFTHMKWGFPCIMEEYPQYYRRWNQLSDISYCYWEEVKLR